PGQDNYALSKVPAIFDQELKPRSQYDGSIDDHVVRSLVAAYTSGSSVEALSKPEIASNIHKAADFTLRAGRGDSAASYRSLFPARCSEAQAKRGVEVYRGYCLSCHGYRPLSGGEWMTEGAARLGKNVPLSGIGTDPDRVVFRYSEILPTGLQVQFPG